MYGMQNLNTGRESVSKHPREMAETTNIVTQPAKLNELMEVINVMGNISEKFAEHQSQIAASSAGQTSTKAAATTARDEAIKALPKKEMMQQTLIRQINREIATLERQIKAINSERQAGWAYEITKLYARVRRLTALLREITRATVENVKRFYIHVFIDHQPLLASVSVPLAR